MQRLLKSEVDFCKKIMANAGPTYYWATRLMPKKIRHATYVLYAFYRVPDDIVDLHSSDPTQDLMQWVDTWKKTISNPESSLENSDLSPVLSAALKVHQNFNIPFDYSISFLDSMVQDLTKKNYEDYQELENYMYGSASVVGIMMTHLFLQNPSAKVLEKAKSLGEAMQLTNFLRDIHEDLEDRKRVYMPKDELLKFGINSDFSEFVYNQNWKDFMCFQIQRNVNLYQDGFSGLQYLPLHVSFCVKLSAVMYMSFLQQIIDSDFQVFDSKYRLLISQKLKNLVLTLFNKFKYPLCQKL